MSQLKVKPGVTPALIGISISVLLLIGFFIGEQLLGRFTVIFRQSAYIEIRNFRIAIIHCLLAGYLPAAYLYILRSARSIIHELTPLLTSSDESGSMTDYRLAKKWLVVFGILGFLFSVLTPYLSLYDQSPWDPNGWTPEIVWHRILGPVIGWWIGWLGYAVVKRSIQVSRTATLIRSIDLLDLKPLEPFVRQGLINALIITGVAAIFSFTLIEQKMGVTVAGLASLILSLAFLGLFLPAYGVHKRILEVKKKELTWTLEKLREARIHLKDSSTGSAQGQIADLTTYYRFIDRVPEWPFRTSTFFRVILYLFIPVVSWVVGLLIDSALSQLFG
ncbi:MAG: hypothetical protein JSV25_00665 [Spirochaetota bacterium]|nr:MAG: hypothetical protein JSV25_00665 [Spirochaetota bacterium]